MRAHYRNYAPSFLKRMMIMEDQILELTRQVTILNERLPNHITWTERNVLDHEKRIRNLESFRYVLVGASLVGGSIAGAVISQLVGV